MRGLFLLVLSTFTEYYLISSSFWNGGAAKMVKVDTLRRVTRIEELKPGVQFWVVTEPFCRHAKLLTKPSVIDGKLTADFSIEYVLSEDYHRESIDLDAYLAQDRDEHTPSIFFT
jgi:hypothetical protein